MGSAVVFRDRTSDRGPHFFGAGQKPPNRTKCSTLCDLDPRKRSLKVSQRRSDRRLKFREPLRDAAENCAKWRRMVAHNFTFRGNGSRTISQCVGVARALPAFTGFKRRYGVISRTILRDQLLVSATLSGIDVGGSRGLQAPESQPHIAVGGSRSLQASESQPHIDAGFSPGALHRNDWAYSGAVAWVLQMASGCPTIHLRGQ